MQSIINPIFESLTESIIPEYSAVKNYQRDKKIEYHDKKIAYFEELLGLDIYDLGHNELMIINVFLSQSEQSNYNLDCITIAQEKLLETIALPYNNFKEAILKLKSENFLIEKLVGDNDSKYKLNYSVFYKSNLFDKLFNNETSLYYYELLTIVVDIFLNIQSNNDNIEINVNKFMSDNSLNYLFINPIIFHLKSEDIIKYDLLYIQTILLTNTFNVDKSKLLKLKKQLLLKE